MKHQGHFAKTATRREALQIGELIADLDIATHDEHAQVFDRSSTKYPALARMLLGANLAVTISALEGRRVGIHSAQLGDVPAIAPRPDASQRYGVISRFWVSKKI
jgi:hypothetical protein